MSQVRKSDHSTRKLDNNLAKAVDALKQLEDANVSYHLAIHMKGNTRSIGTEGACKVFEENREKFEDALVDDALVDDALNFCNGKIDENVEDSDNGHKAGAKRKGIQVEAW